MINRVRGKLVFLLPRSINIQLSQSGTNYNFSQGQLRSKQDNVQLCETQIESYEDMMTLKCCQDHILIEKYGLYGLKHHIVEISGDVTDAGQPNNRTSEDRATQPMEAGG